MTFVVLAVVFAPLWAGNFEVGATTPVADALNWYSVWWSSKPLESNTQSCRGELRGGLYRLRCDPLAVVVDLAVDDAGYCSIISIRPSMSSTDGLRVQTLEHLVQPRHRNSAQSHDCGELPLKDGRFEILVTPRSRQVDKGLTSDARDAVLRYSKHGGENGCLLRLPNVQSGDPFFHVYEECQGALASVWEFTNRSGKVADFPHWTYTRRRGGLPVGAETRRSRKDLWSGVSRPGDRR